MKIRVVTTCNHGGWKLYGKKMLSSFEKYWSKNIDLVFYPEGFSCPKFDNLIVREFPSWFLNWKICHAKNADAHGRDVSCNRDGRAYDFRRDCVRFSHKIAALTDWALTGYSQDILIWIDADTTTDKDVNEEWIKSFAPNGENLLSWLYRRNTHPECGFLIFNSNHYYFKRFMLKLQDIY
jgi:hypothetical protein